MPAERRAVLPVFFPVLFALGCSPAPAVEDAGAAIDAPAAPDTGAVLDAPAPADAAEADDAAPTDAGPADDAGPGGRGTYFAYHSHSVVGGSTVDQAIISVRFDREGSGSTCTDTTFGDCTYTTCAGGGTAMRAVAGDVTTSGGALASPITVSPRADGSGAYDAFASESVDLWTTPGDVLSVSAPGAAGGVPAFDATIGAPAPLVVTNPSLDGAPSFDRASDLVVTWTATGAPADEIAELALLSTSTPTSVIRCTVPATSGTVTVPSAALSMLPAGSGAVTVAGVRRTTVTAGSWSIELQTDDRIPRAITLL